jgi:hypothetical protein
MNDDVVNRRNPLGIKLTKEQMDESFRKSYWAYAVRYGLQYYVAGRFAATHRLTPVLANLLHHAVELLLKACLSNDDAIETIKKYRQRYSHDILKLWDAFRSRKLDPGLVEFDEIIAALNDFEEIRYPERLIENGANMGIDLFVEEPKRINGQEPGRSYYLSLPPIDRLMGLLFEASNANPEVFLREIEDVNGVGSNYYQKLKATSFGRAPA